MTVTHKFKKRPKPANAEKRSLSFMPDETKSIKDDDIVNIIATVTNKLGTSYHDIDITLNGGDFLRLLEDKKIKSSGEDFYIFKF